MKRRILSFALAVLMVVACIPAIALPSLAAETALVNVALGKTVTAGNGNNASKLTDGSTSGYFDLGWWGTGNDPTSAYPLAETTCWVEIDLGQSYDIEKLDVSNLHQNYYWFEVYASNDNTAAITDSTKWTKIAEYTGTAASTWDHTFTLDAPVNCRYIRAYGTYHSGNVGYHFTEISAYAEGSIEDLKNTLSISSRYVTFENWGNNTQLLIAVADSRLERESAIKGEDVIVDGEWLQGKLDDGTYTTQLVVSTGGSTKKVYDVTYDSKADVDTFRFEICREDVPFIPGDNNNYVITLNVLDENGEVWASGTNTWNCNINPLYVFDDSVVPVVEKEINWYNMGEVKNGSLIILPQHMENYLFGDADGGGQLPSKVEMIVGTAVYEITPFVNYNWGIQGVMAGIKIIEEGFTPVQGEEYSPVFKFYVNSTPSGKETLVATYTMKDPLVLAEGLYAENVPYIYDIYAKDDKGTVGVDFDAATKTYTVTELGAKDGYYFDHWEVDGESVGTDSTYTFVAVDGVNSVVQAVYGDAVAVTWNVNGETKVTYVKPGTVPVAPVTPSDYSDYNWDYTYVGLDKEITAVTEATTYTAQYTKAVRAPRVVNAGKYGEGFENWSGETQMYFYLESDTVDLLPVWENRDNYRFEFTYEWTDENGETKTATSECSPWSTIWTATSSSLTMRFEVSSAPHSAFNPVNGQEYIVNVKVYDMTLTEEHGEDGYLYLVTENTDLTYVLNADPITYEYYTITWTQNGETIATETWREGLTPVAPVVASYTEGKNIYTLNTPVVEVSGDATYEIVYDVTDTTAITLGKYGSGWENWENSPNKTEQYPSVTQLLLTIKDYKGEPISGLYDNRANYTWELTIDGKTYVIAPETYYGDGAEIYRFEVCLNKTFIPVAGQTYEIGLRILDEDKNVVYYSDEPVSTTVPSDFEPIVPVVLGDADNDGGVSINDVTVMLNYLAASEEERAEMLAGGMRFEEIDCDGDGDVSINDVTVLLNILSTQTA